MSIVRSPIGPEFDATGRHDKDPDDEGQNLLALRDLCITERNAVEGSFQWRRCELSYGGQSYDGVKMPRWRPRGQNPKAWEVVQRFVPMMTDARPRPEIEQVGSEDELVAARLSVGFDIEWDRQDMQGLHQRGCRSELAGGNAFLQTYIERSGLRPKLKTRLVSQRNVYPAPSASTINDAPYVWIRSQQSNSEIWATYGTDKKTRRALREVLERLSKPSGSRVKPYRVHVEPYGGQSPSGISAVTGTPAQIAAGSVKPMELIDSPWKPAQEDRLYDVWECFYAPHAELEDVAVPMADGTTETLSLPKYPKGRIVTMIEDQYVEELDREGECWHGQIPLSHLLAEDVPEEFFGRPYILPGLDLIDEMNELANQIRVWMKFALNPERKADPAIGIDFDNDYSWPGKLTPVPTGMDYEWMVPPDIPNGLFQRLSDLDREFDKAMGLNDISRGMYQGELNRVSGKAVQELAEPSNDRIRPILANNERGLARWAFQTVCNMIQFYPREMWDALLPMELKPMMEQVAGMDPMTGQPIMAMVPDPNGLFGWEEWQEESADEIVDIRIAPGSSLPENKEGRANKAVILYDKMGFGAPGSPEAIDELLRAHEWPGRERIVKQVRTQQAMMPPAGAAPPTNGASPTSERGGNEGLNKALGMGPPPASVLAVENSPEGQEVPA